MELSRNRRCFFFGTPAQVSKLCSCAQPTDRSIKRRRLMKGLADQCNPRRGHLQQEPSTPPAFGLPRPQWPAAVRARFPVGLWQRSGWLSLCTAGFGLECL
ncbi:hypothetical protein VUR80DRAFT_7531 [Thermomyces stellatus]